MYVVWTEKSVKPSCHPAFERCTKTQIGQYTFLGDTYPINECKLQVPKLSKKLTQQWAQDKIKHLESWGIKGSIVP